MTSERAKFLAWLERCGAAVMLPKSEWEFARFRARDELCIVYRDGYTRAGGTAPTRLKGNGPLAAEAFQTWRDSPKRARMDLTNAPAEPDEEPHPPKPREVWAFGDRLIARVAAGERPSLHAEAAALRVPVFRMIRIAQVRGLDVVGAQIVPKGTGQQLDMAGAR